MIDRQAFRRARSMLAQNSRALAEQKRVAGDVQAAAHDDLVATIAAARGVQA